MGEMIIAVIALMFILMFIAVPVIVIVVIVKLLRKPKSTFNMSGGFGGSQVDWNMQQEQQRQFYEQQRQFEQQQFDEQNRQFMQHSMDECMKSGTPFEMGGYDMTQGNSFNDPNINNPNMF